ncbi:unnamed protein product, partial [Rotaria magnacalcarata]
MYKLCTVKGVLSVFYGVQVLLDLRKCDFADLRTVDPASLPTIAFTQACKEYVTTGINPVAEICHCNGKCATKSCPCKAKDVKCCTKCHPKKSAHVQICRFSSKIMLKIIQRRLQPFLERELPDTQAGFRKGRGTRDQIANLRWIIEK